MGGRKTFGTEVLTSGDVNGYLMQQSLIRVDSGSRPTAQNGTHIWETDNLRDYVYNGTTWEALGFPSAKFAYKTADESLTSSTTFQNDDHLSVNLPASSRWLIDLYLISSAAGGIGLHWELLNPGGGNAIFTSYAANTPSSDDSVSVSLFYLSGTGDNYSDRAGTSDIVVVARSILMVVGTGGAVTLRWAQGASSGTPLIVRAKSFMYARRVE